MQLMRHSTCIVRTAAACCFPTSSMPCWRLFSQASSNQMVEDMIQFVRTACQGNTQQALDVLNTGIAHQEGPGHDRLQLAMAEVHAANSNWAAVVEHALPVAQQQGSVSDHDLAPKMQHEASLLCVRALLTQGKDEQATQLALQAQRPADSSLTAEPARQQAYLETTSSLVAALHATGDFERSAAYSRQLQSGHFSGLPKSGAAAALKQAATLLLAEGQLAEAEDLFGQASLAADHSQANSTITDLRPPQWHQQLAADAWLGAAQTAAAQHAWDKAEKLLTKALHLAEQLHGGASQTPQVGVVLGLLGHVYACSKRITLAEGLHRQAVKLLRLDPSAPTGSQPLLVHSSLAAAAAWRYSQLLTVLPRRDTEASSWKQFAIAHSPSNSDLASVLGPLDVLAHSGSNRTSGNVVDLMLLRALPCS